ncbi:MAG: hypothetical protein D4R63_06055 [Methylococcaceae bacterium]|nr:MAG: hypothetical protein D4R63_06055 [Methylococcaceae bacterium]
MAKNYDPIIADFYTGAYSQRQLAKIHKVSLGTVNKVTKGLVKKNERLVHKKVEVIQEYNALSSEEMNAVDGSVHFKLSLLSEVNSFSSKALKKAQELLDAECTGQGFKAIVEGVDKLTVTNGLNPRFATTAQIEINNSNVQANLLAESLPSDPIDAARTYQELIGK